MEIQVTNLWNVNIISLSTSLPHISSYHTCFSTYLWAETIMKAEEVRDVQESRLRPNVNYTIRFDNMKSGLGRKFTLRSNGIVSY